MTETTETESVPAQSEFLMYITRMCDAHQWKLSESDADHAVITFAIDKKRAQTLFIFGFENEIEFSVPSFAAFDSLDDVPHIISSTLLQINAKTKIGFWCLEQIGEKFVYTFMHNASMQNVTEADFGDIVNTLVQRVDEFEALLEKMSLNGDPKPDSPSLS